MINGPQKENILPPLFCINNEDIKYFILSELMKLPEKCTGGFV